MVSQLVHGCYDQKWQNKVGSAIGLKAMCQELSVEWVLSNDVKIVNAVLSLFQHHPFEYQAHVFSYAQQTLNYIFTKRPILPVNVLLRAENRKCEEE